MASSEIAAAIDRSIPPIMTTSICPRATRATTLPSGSRLLNDVEERVDGATIWQTIRRIPVAIQIVTNRELNSKLLVNDPRCSR